MKYKQAQSGLEIQGSSRRPLTGDFWAAVVLAIYVGGVAYAYGEEPQVPGTVCDRAEKVRLETKPSLVTEFIAGKNFDGSLKIAGISPISVEDLWGDLEGEDWREDFFSIKKIDDSTYYVRRETPMGYTHSAVIFISKEGNSVSCSFSSTRGQEAYTLAVPALDADMGS